jgi:hypothetical protein
MIEILPFTDDGSSKVTMPTSAGILTFVAYFMPLLPGWLVDISNANGTPLITGLNLVTNVDNLLKGQGDILNGYTLRVYSVSGVDNNTPDSLGKDCQVLLFSPGEVVPAIGSL